MKKKLLALLISIITAVLVFTGCASTNPLTGIEGTPIGNGTFLVEKGNYVYFVNGQESTTADNTFNTPVKASLVRVKKSELASQTKSEPEIVVPKIIMTGTYNVGVYFFGNSVYYATPCTNKDKTGTIQNQKTEFISLNLKTGKQGKSIAISETNTCEFRYVEVGDKVYLLYTFSEVVDNVTQNKFKVVDASNGKDVYVSPAYANVAFPDDSSLTVFYSKVAFSESLDQDTAFNDLYSYKVGDTEDKLAIAGAGYYETTRNEVYKTAQKFIGINGEVINGIEGVTITLIKNTGKYVILKATTLDSTYTSNIYFGAEIDNGAIKAGTIKCLGHSNVITDNAITATSYYESLEEIY